MAKTPLQTKQRSIIVSETDIEFITSIIKWLRIRIGKKVIAIKTINDKKVQWERVWFIRWRAW